MKPLRATNRKYLNSAFASQTKSNALFSYCWSFCLQNFDPTGIPVHATVGKGMP